mgnify:CR=1 FL=1|tara:strand:- start:586 stop:1062 length:477 start_codon:yes stop_codon:yes gene_type:complete
MTYIPKSPESYIGNQVIINSDRLLFNAKTDSILLYSDKAIGFSTKGNFHFDNDNSEDSESKFIVNSPSIYLGLEFDNSLPEQPAVLADNLIESLEDILDLILTVYSDITFQVAFLSMPPGSPTAMNPNNIQILNKRNTKITTLKENLQDIKSKKIKLV